MRIRTLLALSLVGVGTLASSGTGAAQTPPVLPVPPNVLIILTDDQRAQGTLEDMPQTQRRFQEGGITYTNGYVTTPLCCPSRASIMTGRYAHNHGVLRNRRPRQLDHETTLQYYLQEAGYNTAISGKFLTSWRLRDDPPHFDRWAILNHGYNDAVFNLDGKLTVGEGYSTTYVSGQANKFLRDFELEDVKPWYLYVAPIAPHRPSTPEARYAQAPVSPWTTTPAMQEQHRRDKPPYVRARKPNLDKAQRLREQQQRSLKSVDDLVAETFATLDELGETEATMAFFLSDNGFLLGEHGVIGKRLPYTESVEVPFMMRWPGHVSEGTTDQRLAANIDIAPTVMGALEDAPLGPSAPPMDGRSLLSGDQRDYAFIEHWGNPDTGLDDWGSLRNEEFQLIKYYLPYSARTTFKEYYDLRNDVWQLENLLRDGNPGNDPSNLAELQQQLVAARRCAGDNCP